MAEFPKLGEPVLRVTRAVVVTETIPVAKAAEYYGVKYVEDTLQLEDKLDPADQAQRVIEALSSGESDNTKISMTNQVDMIFPWVYADENDPLNPHNPATPEGSGDTNIGLHY